MNFGRHYLTNTTDTLLKHLNRHANGKKHQDAVLNKQELKTMKRKGNIVSQITTGANNAALEKRERNRRVIKKLLKTVYFLARKKWAVKQNFEDVITFIRDFGDEDLKKHFTESGKNATYVSNFTVDEFITIISDHIEEKH